MLSLSEGEDNLRDKLIEEEGIPGSAYCFACLLPVVGGLALLCAFQAQANHTTARENFLRGHRRGALKRYRRSRFWKRISVVSNFGCLVLALTLFLWFKIAFQNATRLTRFGGDFILKLVLGCWGKDFYGQCDCIHELQNVPASYGVTLTKCNPLTLCNSLYVARIIWVTKRFSRTP